LFILMVAGTAAGLASPYALKIIIDDHIPKKDYEGILLVLGGLVLTYIFRLGIGFLSDYTSTWIANKVVHNIKARLFHNLVNQPYHYFEENNSGDIIQKVNQEIHKVQHFLTNSILRVSNNIFAIAGLSVMLCYLDYKLFLLALTVFPFSIVLNRIWNKKIKVLIEKISVTEGGIFNFYIDRIKNIKVIKTYNAAGAEVKSLVQKLEGLFDLYQRSAAYASLGRNTSTFFVVLGPLIVLAYGGYQAVAGVLTTGALVAFIQYMNRLYAPSNDMVFFYVDWVSARVSMQRILPLLQPVQTPQGDMSIDDTVITSVCMEEVSFSYGQHEVISKLSFELVRGRSYALVGLSGSGKSTILKILCRLYNPPAGRIMINNAFPLQEVNPASWHEQVNIIHQEPLLFTESIRFNLTYGNKAATDEALWNALEAVGLHAMVQQLPRQLDTVLGDGQTGVMLSGGQQQQVAIARALLKGGQVLILDEATSAIDSYKERLILEYINKHYKDSIIISISHRLSAVCDQDEIIVLHEGRIAERGTHDQLTAREGHYHLLFRNQFKGAGQVAI